MTPFDYINAIKDNKLVDDYKGYNPFLSIKGLSMDFKNLPVCNMVNKFTFLKLSKEQHYKLVYNLPWVKSRPKWIKGKGEKNKELINILLTHWDDTSIRREDVVMMIEKNVLTIEDIVDMLRKLGLEPKNIKKLTKEI